MSEKASSDLANTTTMTETKKETKKMYSMEEVKLHNKEEDMWMVVYGEVYDVTAFSDDHPGGPEILSENSGIDATEAFEEVFHSAAAREQIKQFHIGSLEGYEGAGMPESGSGGGAGAGGNNLVFLVPILLVVA